MLLGERHESHWRMIECTSMREEFFAPNNSMYRYHEHCVAVSLPSSGQQDNSCTVTFTAIFSEEQQ